MESENQVEDIFAGGTGSTSGVDQSPGHPVLPARQDLRRKRIDDYRDEGLARPVAGEACLAAVNADLFAIVSGIGEAINQSLNEGPPSLETVVQLEPALNGYSRLTKQLGSQLQLEARMAADRARTNDMKMQLQTLALQSHLADAVG